MDPNIEPIVMFHNYESGSSWEEENVTEPELFAIDPDFEDFWSVCSTSSLDDDNFDPWFGDLNLFLF